VYRNIKYCDVKHIEEKVMQDGELKIVNASYYEGLSNDELSNFALKHAFYSIPTVELINFLKEEIGGEQSVLEIRSGQMGKFKNLYQLQQYLYQNHLKNSDFTIKNSFVLVGFSEGDFIMRKIVPGWRFFGCEECSHMWQEKCRDCESPSGEYCDICHGYCHHYESEPHPEWLVDTSGNLIDES